MSIEISDDDERKLNEAAEVLRRVGREMKPRPLTLYLMADTHMRAFTVGGTTKPHHDVVQVTERSAGKAIRKLTGPVKP